MKRKKNEFWVEVDSIPKSFEPQDTLLIPDHKFVKKEALIKYAFRRSMKNE